MKLRNYLIILGFLILISANTINLVNLSNANIGNRIISLKNSNSELYLENLDGKSISEKDFINGNPVVIMLIDPSCNACSIMIDKLVKYSDEFQNVNLVIVTESNLDQFVEFINSRNLGKYENFNFAIDKNGSVSRKFNLQSTPSFLVFDSQLNLIISIDQDPKISILIKYVRQAVSSSCT